MTDGYVEIAIPSAVIDRRYSLGPLFQGSDLIQFAYRGNFPMTTHNAFDAKVRSCQCFAKRDGVVNAIRVGWVNRGSRCIEIADEDQFLVRQICYKHACRMGIRNFAQLDRSLPVCEGSHILRTLDVRRYLTGLGKGIGTNCFGP